MTEAPDSVCPDCGRPPAHKAPGGAGCGWDLWRKAAMWAVVGAARVVLDAHTMSNTVKKGMAMVSLREALRALSSLAEAKPEPLSPEAQSALTAGLDSARRGEVRTWGDFTKYAEDDDEPVEPMRGQH